MTGAVAIPAPVQELMQQILSEYAGRKPRYRYFENRQTKEMFCWTVETVDGKYVCWTYRPIGTGSRSGHPRRWTAVDRVDFAKRKAAKARAYARYLKSKESEMK